MIIVGFDYAIRGKGRPWKLFRSKMKVDRCKELLRTF